MFKNPGNWFPDLFFANAFAILIIILSLVDYILPKLLGRRRSGSPTLVRDRGSYQVIYFASVGSLIIGFAFRYWNWGLSLGTFQYAGLGAIILGLYSQLGDSQTGAVLFTHRHYREGSPPGDRWAVSLAPPPGIYRHASDVCRHQYGARNLAGRLGGTGSPPCCYALQNRCRREDFNRGFWGRIS